MNPVKMTRDITTKAIKRFATNEGVLPNEVQLFIKSGADDENGQLSLAYHYAVKGKFAKNEAGEIITLTWTDVLGVKYDPIPMREPVTKAYLDRVFRAEAREFDCNTSDIFVGIIPTTDASDVICCLYKGGKIIKKMTLKDLFADE